MRRPTGIKKAVDEGRRRAPTEAFLQGVLDGIEDIIKIVDKDFRILYANQAIERLLNRPVHECLGQKCHAVIHGFKEAPGYCLTPKTFATGERCRHSEWMEMADGARRFIEYSTFPIKGPKGEVVSVVEVIHDATEKKLAEEQLIHNARLVTLGETAAGIAHEVRTPLNAIRLGIEALGPALARDREAQEVAEVIRRNLDRMDGFIGEMLTFARKEPPVRTLQDIRPVIRGAIDLVEKQARDGKVQIITSFPEDTGKVSLAASPIQQVIVNVLLNSIQAMPEGGQVRITAGRHTEGGREGLLLSLADSGPGIPDKDKNRVFEPFFSTKPTGTGLGLAIAAKIVKDHGGRIWLRDAEPQGAVVEVFLPGE